MAAVFLAEWSLRRATSEGEGLGAGSLRRRQVSLADRRRSPLQAIPQGGGRHHTSETPPRLLADSIGRPWFGNRHPGFR